MRAIVLEATGGPEQLVVRDVPAPDASEGTVIVDVRAAGINFADVLIRLPKVPVLLQPLVAVLPLQLFACELATLMGHDVDQPRNLAKSVTVE